MNTGNSSVTRQDPSGIRSMFDSIAPTYDLLNHLLSFGMDIHWRSKAIRYCASKRGGTFLDIAAGSGDVSIGLLSLQPKLVVATDFAFRMLEVFQEKINRRTGAVPIHLASCDAHHLPFRGNTFDGTFVAFGIRNFADRGEALREMFRVLKPGGISVVLELTEPTSPFVSQLYSLHSRVILPIIGAIISRHNAAYRYLPRSIAAFPAKEEFLSLMAQAGLSETAAHPLTFGTATVFTGIKAISGPV
jgi:demethylmenaquinone methyltransferase / 2-methoxy-6-polyprenyl-1,4-benzoquinol methylase